MLFPHIHGTYKEHKQFSKLHHNNNRHQSNGYFPLSHHSFEATTMCRAHTYYLSIQVAAP